MTPSKRSLLPRPRMRRPGNTNKPLMGALDSLATRLAAAFQQAGDMALPDLPNAAQALLAWVCCQRLGRPLVLIADSPSALEVMHRDLRFLNEALIPARGKGAPVTLVFYPAFEASASRRERPDPELAGLRTTALRQLAAALTPPATPGACIIATDVHALLQPVPTPTALQAASYFLRPGDTCDPAALVERLAGQNFTSTPQVQGKGQFAVRGGILDLWPVDQVWPLRLEFYGSVIDSIRTFDPADQRSLVRIGELTLTPAGLDGIPADASTTLAAYVPPGAVLLWTDYASIVEHAALQREAYDEAGMGDCLLGLDALESALRAIASVSLTPSLSPKGPLADLTFIPFPDINAGVLTQDPDALLARRHARLAETADNAAAGRPTLVFFDTPGARDHYAAALPLSFPTLPVHIGNFSSGFRCDALNLILLAESDLYSRHKVSAERYDPLGDIPRPAARRTGERLAELGNLEPDDLVIHVQHGLGRYRGLLEIEMEGERQEVISIEYAEGARLHIPTRHAHLLSRYVGVSGRKVALHRLGGKRWDKEKQAAERAIVDMAAALLETQAQRTVLHGTAFPADNPWQHEFETAFPYRETPDQVRVIAEIKQDMESTRPMDRLLCGDAGYGKTEVAMRAAFKAVMGGKQVAMLVPTTVLAQQHFFTFRDRMRAYPIRIEMLSRFCTGADKRAIIEDLRQGSIDIVIATHSLLQDRIRFRNLGLAIIDEEQRFGVQHKEKIKDMRRMVDVLTLTATPIPRTLYMSMTGAKDLSLLQTPPRERMAIETIVEVNTDHVVREAILREINRGGQAYYLHNRVMTIERVAERLRALIPQARLAVAHGQMPTTQLRQIVRAFVEGDYDVLLCTVIIESGVDIPRANTILIDRADRFGLADLYQLRGRVGRSHHKAYAYLLLPPHGHMDRDARRRINALQRNSALGAGFQLALQDLEIRGAGNILGAEQSGHITAIGFGLYCQMLKRTVAQLKGEALPSVIDVDLQLDFIDLAPANADRDNSVTLPYVYVDDDHLRVEFYRRFAEIASEAEVAQLRLEVEDRYGPPAPPLNRLFDLARLRLAAHDKGISAIRVRDGKVRLMRGGDPLLLNSRFPYLTATSAADRIAEILQLVNTSDAWAGVKGFSLPLRRPHA